MIKTLLRKQKFRERDEKTNFSLLLLLLCLSFYVLRRSTTTKEDRQTFFLLLSFFRVHMRGLLPEEEVKKTNRRRCFSHEAVLTCYSQSSFELRRERSNFVSPKSVGVRCFRSQERSPPFLSSVLECDEREKEVYICARREKIRICAIVPLSAMISSSSSESTSIVAVIFCDERVVIGVRVFLFVSLFSSAEERFFASSSFSFLVFRVSKFVWEFFFLAFLFQLFCVIRYK